MQACRQHEDERCEKAQKTEAGQTASGSPSARMYPPGLREQDLWEELKRHCIELSLCAGKNAWLSDEGVDLDEVMEMEDMEYA